MASRRDGKRTGAIFKAAERAYLRRLRNVQQLYGRATGDAGPSLGNLPRTRKATLQAPVAVVDNLPSQMESNEDNGTAFSESSDEEDEVPAPESPPVHPYGDLSFVDGLRLWALDSDLSQHDLNLLLGHIRNHLPGYNWPLKARDFLNTPVPIMPETKLMAVAGGHQWYQGIAKCLQTYFRGLELINWKGFTVDFFVDAVSLSKTRRSHLWSMLMKVRNVPDVPVMMISIFYGSSKPNSVEQYLRPFVTELNELQEHGIIIEQSYYGVYLGAIRANDRVRAFIKGVESPSPENACEKCTIVAQRDENGRLFFKWNSTLVPRTDELFRAGVYPLHIQNPTPLTDLSNCDIVKDILVTDEKRLLYKGVLAKLVLLWLHGFENVPCMLPPQERRKVSAHLRQLKLPSDFQHRSRLCDLRNIVVWRASEFGAFLQLAGFVVLKGRLPDAVYKHFMLFFVAITLLSSTHHKEKWDFAEQLLNMFVARYATVYGEVQYSRDVHNLLHICGEVRRFETVNIVSDSSYEPKRRSIKKFMHKENNSLMRTVHRLLQQQQVEVGRWYSSVVTGERHQSVHITSSDTIVYVRRGLMLRKNFRDQWCMTNYGMVIRYEMAETTENDLIVRGYTFRKLAPAFTEPCLSFEATIYSANMTDLDTGKLRSFPSSMIMCKAGAIQTECEGQFMFVPLAHTYAA